MAENRPRPYYATTHTTVIITWCELDRASLW